MIVLLMMAAAIPDIRATPLDMRTFAFVVKACTSSTAPDYIADLPPKKAAVAKLICKAYQQGIKDGKVFANGGEVAPRVLAHELAVSEHSWPPK